MVAVFPDGLSTEQLEPRIENDRGSWRLRDRLGADAMQIEFPSAELVLPWIAEHCNGAPREIYLVGFGDPEGRSILMDTIARACDRFRPIHVELHAAKRCGFPHSKSPPSPLG